MRAIQTDLRDGSWRWELRVLTGCDRHSTKEVFYLVAANAALALLANGRSRLQSRRGGNSKSRPKWWDRQTTIHRRSCRSCRRLWLPSLPES